jgi:hypothetical protein
METTADGFVVPIRLQELDRVEQIQLRMRV